MMRKYTKISLSVCLVALLVFSACPVSAQLVAGATFDFSGDAQSVMANVEAKLNSIQEEVVAKVKEKLTEIKAAASKYAGKILKIVDKVPGSKDATGSSVDIYDADAVQAAFTELFMQYPTDDERLNKMYELKADQFYYDTLVEMKTAVTAMEEQLSTLREEVDKFGDDAISLPAGGGDTAGSEDESGMAYNAYMAARKFNDILKITQQLVAMQNQYYAARLIRQPKVVFPAPYEKTDTKGKNPKTSFIYGHSRMGFAQMLSKQSASATVSSAAAQTNTAMAKDATPVAAAIGTEDKKIVRVEDSFVVPEAPETQAMLQGSEAELAALSRISKAQEIVTQAVDVHNVLKRMPEYRDMYRQYDLFKRLHAKAVEAVKDADGCVIRYIGRRYSEPNKVWFGQNTEPQNTCDYDSRKGLSGWAIAAYQVANASVGNDIDVDAFAETDIDTTDDSSSLTEIDTEKLEAANAEKDSAAVFTNPSKAQEFSDSVREVELLNWQIGRKAAQYLADDQNSEKPIYGKAANPYPLWNDQRSYYNGYLSGKYDNMKAYLNHLNVNTLALEIAEALNNGHTEGTVKNNNKKVLTAIAKLVSAAASSNSNVDTLLANKEQALASIRKKQDAALAPYVTELAELNEKIDGWSVMIDNVRADINEVDRETKLNESRAEIAQKEIETMNKRGTSGYSSTYAMAKQTFDEAGAAQAEGITKLGHLRTSVAQYENARDKALAEKTALEEKMNEIKEGYQEEIVDIESEYDAKIAEAENTVQSAPKLLSLFNSAYTSAQSRITYADARELLSDVDSLVEKARSCAGDLIQAHYEDLMSMAADDALYLAANNGKVVAKHKTLIQNLEKLPSKCFTTKVNSVIGTLNVSSDSIISLLSGVFKSALTKTVCANYSCDAADKQYFVGLPAKGRDFTAPRAPLATRYPAVRDMVHLDTTDYKKIEIGKGGKISRTAFLNYGLNQPYIWELMLSDKAYVERGMNLASALDKGGEAKAFLRGTILPCRSGNYIIDIQSNGTYSILNTKKENNPENIKKLNGLSECRDLSIVGQIPGIAQTLETYIVHDKDIDDKNNTVLGNAGDSVKDPDSSELGMFLRYKNGILKINDRPYDGYTRLISKEKKAEKSGKYELSAEDNIYQRAMFTKNQIGDFLHFVDKESRVKKNIDEIEAGMEEVKTTLSEIFANMGFELKSNLNLADSSDYNYVVGKLKERKNTLMSEAGAELDTISSGNEVVKERFDKVKNTYSALMQDTKALVNITANTESGSPLVESIKSEEANEKVIEKSRNEGYSALENEIKNYEQPICMPY